ncbi:MAG: HNH endonuclease [Candidatus Heimdallarchaeota archaeon]
MNSIQMFEMILNSGVRTTTYKFGLLTGIVDYVIKNPLEPPKNNFHFIPIFYLSKQFLAHYYPLVLSGIRQGPDLKEKSPTKIKNLLLNFRNSSEIQKHLPFPLDVENINLFLSFIDNNDKLPKELIRLLFDIRWIIIHQPLKYVQNVKDKQVTLFGLLSSKDPFQSDFEDHRKTGLQLKWSEIKSVKNWNDLIASDNLHIFFSHQTYHEISNMRFWLRDVLIKRWAQECVERFDANSPNLLSLFDLWKKIPQRESSIINKYCLFYLENGLKICTYCNQSIEKDLQLDHLLPWSKFPVNSFWNLYPVCSSCNSKKSDKIPKITRKIGNRIKKHLQLCLEIESKSDIISKDISKIYKNRFHSSPDNISIEQKMEEIFEYIDSLSNNLLEAIPGYEF